MCGWRGDDPGGETVPMVVALANDEVRGVGLGAALGIEPHDDPARVSEAHVILIPVDHGAVAIPEGHEADHMVVTDSLGAVDHSHIQAGIGGSLLDGGGKDGARLGVAQDQRVVGWQGR